MKKLLGLTSILLATGLAASASPVTPTFTSFGTLAGATFGGTGIPNNAVAITTINTDAGDVTLGLTATPRYSAPAVGNDGAGTFFATPGSANGKALWNFDYYFNAPSTDVPFTFKLLYGYGTDESSLYSFDPTTIGDNAPTSEYGGQNSENLVWFLPGFNPNANGQYSFELQAFDPSGNYLGQSAIIVDVGSVPDTGSTVWLLGFGFFVLAFFGFRQHRRQAVS